MLSYFLAILRAGGKIAAGCVKGRRTAVAILTLNPLTHAFKKLKRSREIRRCGSIAFGELLFQRATHAHGTQEGPGTLRSVAIFKNEISALEKRDYFPTTYPIAAAIGSAVSAGIYAPSAFSFWRATGHTVPASLTRNPATSPALLT